MWECEFGFLFQVFHEEYCIYAMDRYDLFDTCLFPPNSRFHDANAVSRTSFSRQTVPKKRNSVAHFLPSNSSKRSFNDSLQHNVTSSIFMSIQFAQVHILGSSSGQYNLHRCIFLVRHQVNTICTGAYSWFVIRSIQFAQVHILGSSSGQYNLHRCIFLVLHQEARLFLLQRNLLRRSSIPSSVAITTVQCLVVN